MTNGYSVLEKLVKIIGPSGFEKDIQKHYANIMRPYVDSIYKDNIGNCYAEMRGNENLPKVLVNAHADTVGFQIKHINDKGFIFASDITGFPAVDYRMLPGTEVIILNRYNNKEIIGHFQPTIPCHHVDDDEMKESIDRNELLIDIGARDQDHAKRFVNIGDYVVMEAKSRYHHVDNSHFVSSNLDDRAGLFCMYRMAKAIREMKPKSRAPVVFVSTVTEENWAGGAIVAGQNVNPHISVTLDVTVAADTIQGTNEDIIAQKYGTIALDKGPAIPRGTCIDDDTFLFLENICRGKINKKFKIPYQVEIDNAGVAENAQLYFAGKEGVKSCSVYIPCRNTHTRIETISLGDLESTIQLCTEFYKQISQGNYK